MKIRHSPGKKKNEERENRPKQQKPVVYIKTNHDNSFPEMESDEV